MDLVSISEIEDIKSVCSPHAEELKKFGDEWVSLFREFEEEDLENVSRLIGGRIEDLGLDEEWALTKEFFPGVRIHISYHYHGEEFSSYGEEDMLRFMFSGERVRSVTAEDLAGIVDVMLNFIGRTLSGEVEGGSGKRKELGEKYYTPRKKAVDFLDTSGEELTKLADFLGGQFESDNSKKILRKRVFPNVFVIIVIDNGNLESLSLEDETGRLADYERDLLTVYTLNHIVRFVAQRYSDRGLPKICEKVFP